MTREGVGQDRKPTSLAGFVSVVNCESESASHKVCVTICDSPADLMPAESEAKMEPRAHPHLAI